MATTRGRSQLFGRVCYIAVQLPLLAIVVMRCNWIKTLTTIDEFLTLQQQIENGEMQNSLRYNTVG
jgi:hypothetical protein